MEAQWIPPGNRIFHTLKQLTAFKSGHPAPMVMFTENYC